MTGLRDVAKRAGVSISTVSLALREDPRIKASTRQRVVAAAADLGYRPNGLARDLKAGRTGMISVLIHDLGGPFYSELLRGVQARTLDLGYTTIVGCTAGGQDGALTRLLTENRTDGAIVLDASISEDLLSSIASASFPVVVLDRVVAHPYVYLVTCDHEAGAYMATEHLIQSGYRHIAFVSGLESSLHSRLRYKGYLRALSEYDLAADKEYLYHGTYTEDSGYEIGLRMAQAQHMPEAVFSANDEMAIGILRAVTEYGLKVPDDLAIVGFDDVLVTQYVTPPLTTVRQPMYELGVEATKALSTALGGNFDIRPVVLQTELVIRASSGRPRTRDSLPAHVSPVQLRSSKSGQAQGVYTASGEGPGRRD